jgi:hypothetical protein
MTENLEAYFRSIVQCRNGKYVIEHNGRRFTSRRRRSLRRTLSRLLAKESSGAVHHGG